LASCAGFGVKAAELETVELEQQGDTAIEVDKYALKWAGSALLDQGKYIVI